VKPPAWNGSPPGKLTVEPHHGMLLLVQWVSVSMSSGL
jgi:hypothetical protein